MKVPGIPTHVPRRGAPRHPEPEDIAASLARDGVGRCPKPQDPGYLDWIRRLTCCWCEAPPPSEAHHYPAKGMGGARADDANAVPLCTSCHRAWHAHGTLDPGTRQDTELHFHRAQVRCLLAYGRAQD